MIVPSIPRPLVPDDDGSADAAVSAALAAYAAGTADATAVLSALSRARLLIPVVALLTAAEVGADGRKRDKESEMALPKLVGADGREAVLAFTGSAALAGWRADARPVQATALQVCQAAVRERAAAVVVDVAGPVPFVIEGTVLEVMAAVESGTVEGLDSVTVARVGGAPAGRGSGRSGLRGWFGRLFGPAR